MDIQKMLEKQLTQEYTTFGGKQFTFGGLAGLANMPGAGIDTTMAGSGTPIGVDAAKGGGLSLGSITGALGMAAPFIKALTPEQTTNEAGVASSAYDFDADLTRSQADKKNKKMGVANTVLDLAQNIPGVGGAIAGGMKALMPIAGNLLTKKATKQDKIDEYGGIFQSEYQTEQSGKVANAYQEGAWSAKGGYTERLMESGGPVEIGVGGTHEQNPNNGVTISPGNLAEEGEIIVDLPKGQFVFTNRF